MAKGTRGKSVLKRVGVLSVAKLYAAIMGVMGIFVGIIYAFFGAILGAASGSAGLGAGLGLAALILVPLLYAGLGFLMGALTAGLYNLFAGWIGGIEMEFK